MRVLAVVRRRDHLPLLAAVAAVVALVAACVMAVSTLLVGAADRLVRADLDERVGADLVARAGLRLDADAGAQDQRVRAAIDAALGGVRAPTQVRRTVSAEVLVAVAGQPDRRVGLLSDATLPERPDLADLTAGAWPADARQVAVQADAARTLGVRPGSTVVVDDVRFRVVGTWREVDPRDPVWVGSTAEVGLGPVVVDEAAWARLPEEVEPTAWWAWLPDPRAISADDLAILLRGWDDLDDELTVQGQAAAGLGRDGTLVRVAGDLVPQAAGLRAVGPTVWLVLGAIAAVALAELARLFAGAHRRELLLLRARGAAPRRLALSSAAEVGLAAVLGGLVGAEAAALALPSGDRALTAAVPLVVGATVLLAAALVGAAVLGVVGERRRRRSAVRARPRRRLLLAAGAVPIALLAALTVWQLRLYASLVAPAADGGARTDPLAVLAPAALLVAVVVAWAAALPLLGRLLERRGERQGAVAVLAGRSLARRPRASVACLTAVALAGSTTVLAGAVAASWPDSLDLATRLSTGADVRVVDAEAAEADRAVVSDVVGADAVAPVDVQGSGDLGSLVAAAPTALGWLPEDLDERLGLAPVVDSLAAASPGLRLPEGARALRLIVTATGLSRTPAVTAHVVDGLGGEHRLDLPVVDDTPTLVYAAALPPELAGMPGPVTVLALDVDLGGAPSPGSRPSWEVTELSAPTTLDDTTAAPIPIETQWTPRYLGQPDGPVPSGGPLGFLPDAQDSVVRLSPIGGPPVPVAVSRLTADRLDLEAGDRLTLSIEGTYELLDVEVAAVVPAVPGSPTDDAVLIDRAALLLARLSADGPAPPPQLWVRSDGPEATASQLRARLPATARVTTATAAGQRAGLRPVVAGWWTVAAVASLLALVVLAAVSGERMRERRGEVAALRALGLGARQQAALRRRELATAIGLGVVGAGLAGAAAVALVVEPIVRTALPAATPDVGLVVAIAALPVVLVLLVLVAAAAGLVVAHGVAVATQARSARPEAAS